PLGHQLYCLDLELAAELSSRHIQSPIPWSRSYLRVHETGSRPQNRIVAKVDALMALCDRLEAALTAADTTRTRLLEALLHEALAPEARVLEAAE
ncbi:hypothetical protein, partial [Marivita lacus]|uniref:hypothetical protein n=1 Tax=Marivita lacus TaxID=1323742 RepID=UPI001E5C0ABE